MPGIMIDGDSRLFQRAEGVEIQDALTRHMFVTAESAAEGKTVCIRGVHLKDLATFRGPLYQVDRDDDQDALVLRQVRVQFWPWGPPHPAETLDELLLAAFEEFHESLSQAGNGWYAKERDCVNRFVMGHLVPACRAGAAIEHPSQIGMETPVKMPDGIGTKLSSLKDVVIWDVPFGTCWTPHMKPERAPLAVLEWKSQRELGSKQDTSADRAWLKAFCEENPDSQGYAVFLDWAADGVLRGMTVSRCVGGAWNNEWFRRPL